MTDRMAELDVLISQERRGRPCGRKTTPRAERLEQRQAELRARMRRYRLEDLRRRAALARAARARLRA